MNNPITHWLDTCPEYPADFADLLESVTRIGSPTGAEARRVDFMEKWLREQTSYTVERDEIDNLWVDVSSGADKVYLLDAHTDIVFPDETLAITKDGDIWRAPGIYDNTACCVMLMLLLREFSRLGATLPFMVSFTVGEEGTGDLRGIREMVRRHGPRLGEVCAFDLNYHRITVQAVGSIRWKITFQGAGGHSWGDFGNPSAIHAASAWVHQMAGRFPWENRKHSYNIGVIRGGSGVNAIAEEAELLLDLRSVDPVALEERALAIEGDLAEVEKMHGVRASWERIGHRPAGATAPDCHCLEVVREVMKRLDFDTVEAASSTNANAPMAAGIPALCTGLALGGKVHTRAEYLDLNTTRKGWQKLCLIAAGLASRRE